MTLTPPAMLASAASEVDAGHDLLDGCVAGSAAAWRGLHQRYHRTALSVLRRLGVPTAHLDDACQEVFVDVFRYLPRFRREADFRTWLYRICLSRARVARRRARVWSLFSRLSPQVGPDLVEQPFDEGQASRQLARTLEKLTEAERVVFVLFELEGLSGQEIAEVIERPAATVFRRLHDARKRFSTAIEEGL
jgi:RNA polymerase sigma-70 factor, ECF subfamily